jgi:hypothetical protein
VGPVWILVEAKIHTLDTSRYKSSEIYFLTFLAETETCTTRFLKIMFDLAQIVDF